MLVLTFFKKRISLHASLFLKQQIAIFKGILLENSPACLAHTFSPSPSAAP